MYKGEKHIAIFFLLVFILPTIYQPVHILRHHSHRHNCCPGSCHENEPVFQKNNHCFVCEYEFAVTNLPDDFYIPSVEAFVSELIPVRIQDIFFFEVILPASPRAPPFLS